MRQRLLEATVECLVEHGWSGTSTTLVSQRAGVSRGAQLHHFPTKNDLVLAAVEHLERACAATSCAAAAGALPAGQRRTRAVLEMLGRPLHRAGVHRGPRAVGGGAHRRGAARGRRAARAAGRPRGAPARPSSARRRRVAAAATASSCRRPSTWSAASGWPTRSATTPPAGSGSSTAGPTSSTPSCEDDR